MTSPANSPVLQQLFGDALIDEWCRIANAQTTAERDEYVYGYFPEWSSHDAFIAGVEQGRTDAIRSLLMTLGVNWQKRAAP